MFFFNDTATTEIYTLSLHDALPISSRLRGLKASQGPPPSKAEARPGAGELCRLQRQVRPAQGLRGSPLGRVRSEEHTSELQSRQYLVCRLLLEKKKKQILTLLATEL